ncbi:MAG: carboxylesterase family protein [Coriobacteriales bacterium]|nr:carboxylesterase family protein [Coriobacteriales bacterium]
MNFSLTRRGFVGATALAAAGLAACSQNSTSAASSASTADSAASFESAKTKVVQTAYGPVAGVVGEGVTTWYGVPYGANPTGELRWQAPQAPKAWTEELACTEPKDMALQLADGEVVGTEDILNLDIYAPDGADKLPVLVFIHGGNNQTGKAQEIPGTELVVSAGCVYVSLSFRLGALGFNPLPAVTAASDGTGNYAMLDIAAALDWIQANIANFGGDPANVTVSGFSAGGRDVMAMLISPTFEGKFHKAIAFSGGMTTAEIDPSVDKYAAAIAPLVVEDKKAATEAEAFEWLKGTGNDVLEYLMGVDAKRLAPLMGNAGIRMSVFPHLFCDGKVIPGDGFKGAKYTSVPLIMLTGSTEFSFFCLFDAFFSGDAVKGLSEDELNAAKAFANKYGSDMYRIFNAQCSAEAMADSYKAPIYICQVNYGDANSAMSADLTPFGAFHGIFVPMLSSVNGYAEMMNGAFDKAGYQAMAAKFNAYLKAFLASADGTPKVDGETEWTAWTPDKKVSLVLDGTADAAVVEVKDVSSTYDKIIEAMKADTTVSEEVKALVEKNVTNGRWFSDAQDKAFGAPDLWAVDVK